MLNRTILNNDNFLCARPACAKDFFEVPSVIVSSFSRLPPNFLTFFFNSIIDQSINQSINHEVTDHDVVNREAMMALTLERSIGRAALSCGNRRIISRLSQHIASDKPLKMPALTDDAALPATQSRGRIVSTIGGTNTILIDISWQSVSPTTPEILVGAG